MTPIDGALLDFTAMDRLAAGESVIHRLDPRAKVLVTLLFIVTVISFDKHAVIPLTPLVVFPVIMIAAGNLPSRYFLKKIALICPFVLMVGIFNPLIDRTVLCHLGPVGITGGWLSFASIVIRSALTVGAALILVGVTGFPAICRALEQLGVPRIFALQLHLLYRYIFVLTEEGVRISRARELRSFRGRGRGISSFGPLVGSLLLRSWERAERVHMAMLARGFTGRFPTRHQFRFGGRELLFCCGWSALFFIVRLNNLPRLLGLLVTGTLP